MALLPITKGVDHEVLRTKSKLVKSIDKKIKKLVADMIETMFDAEGIGIAAPQVGVNLRIYIARLNVDTPHEVVVPMINPELSLYGDITEDEEGCLSLPKKFGIVPRHFEATITFTDLKNNRITLNLSGLNARIMQHEMDHLNAMLIADRFVGEATPTRRSSRGSKK